MTPEVKKLVSNAKTAISILERNNEKITVAEISNLIRRANRTDVLVMVCGEYKKGKSSLINSIIEQSVCTVDSDIATAAISVIKYGKTPKVIRRYSSGDQWEEHEILFEDIKKYTVGDSPDVLETIQLEIYLNSEILKNGLIIIDSPGIGSTNPMHSHVTRQYISKADIVLFTLAADTPIDDSEVRFFREEIFVKTKKSAIVMNKIDANAGYFEKITDVRSKLSRDWGIANAKEVADNIEIVPYSAQNKIFYDERKDERLLNLSNYGALEKLIESLVSSYRAESIVEAYNFIYHSLENVKKIWLEKHRELSNIDSSSLKELEDIAKKLEQRLKEVNNPTSKFRLNIAKQVEGLRTDVMSSLSAKQIEIRKNAELLIDKGIKPDEIAAEIQSNVETYVEDIGGKISKVKQDVASSLETSCFIDSPEYSTSVSLTDEQKRKIQKYYLPVMIGVGIKALLATLVGGPISLIIAVFVGWKAYKDNNKTAIKASLQKSLQEVFAQLSSFMSAEMSSLNLFVPDIIREFSENIQKRLQETVTVIKKGQSSTNEKVNELNRIVRHEINPINDIQAEILRQKDEIV